MTHTIIQVKINRMKAPRIPGFMPAVWYSKDAESGEAGDVMGEEGMESAKILKGDHIITAQETFTHSDAKHHRRYTNPLLHTLLFFGLHLGH